MGRAGTTATGELPAGTVVEPAPPRPVGVTGPTEPNDYGADASDRTGSGEVSCCAATDDPSRSGCANGTGLRADHRRGGTVPVWQADRELSRSGSGGRLQWRATQARTYQQTG